MRRVKKRVKKSLIGLVVVVLMTGAMVIPAFAATTDYSTATHSTGGYYTRAILGGTHHYGASTTSNAYSNYHHWNNAHYSRTYCNNTGAGYSSTVINAGSWSYASLSSAAVSGYTYTSYAYRIN